MAKPDLPGIPPLRAPVFSPTVVIGDIVFYFDNDLPMPPQFAHLTRHDAMRHHHIVPWTKAVVRKIYRGSQGLVDLQLGFDETLRDATGEMKNEVPRQRIADGQKSGTWQPVV